MTTSPILVSKNKTVERLKLLESEMLGGLNDIRIKCYKSELAESNKKIMDETLATVEEITKDLFASEYYRTRRANINTVGDI